MPGDAPRPDAVSESAGLPPRFADLDQAERRGLIRRSVVRSGITVVIVIVVYAFLPLHLLKDGQGDAWNYVRAGIAVVLAILVLVLQIRAVATARFPQLRVLEGFALAIPLILVVFASSYLSLSEIDGASFSEQLDKVGAIYFALTTMTTVGFGDIHPLSNSARLMVIAQMIVSFGVIGVASRIAYSSVQRRLGADRP